MLESLYLRPVFISRRRHSKEKPFECSYCNVGFADLHALKTHEKSRRHLDQLVVYGMMHQEEAVGHYVEKDKPGCRLTSRNRCGECSFVSLKYSKLRDHYRKRHPDKLFK